MKLGGQQGLALVRLLFSVQMTPLAVSVMWWKRASELWSLFSYKDTNSIMKPPSLWPHPNLITFQRPNPKDHHTWERWGAGAVRTPTYEFGGYKYSVCDNSYSDTFRQQNPNSDISTQFLQYSLFKLGAKLSIALVNVYCFSCMHLYLFSRVRKGRPWSGLTDKTKVRLCYQ